MLADGSTAPPEVVLGYARELASQLAGAAGGLLRAVYLHGSAALGGWVPGRSDIDLLAVTTEEPDATVLDRLAQSLLTAAARCPGRDLESSVVTSAAIARPAEPWPYLLHVAGGPGLPGRVVRPDSGAGDPDLLIHYAVCRARGVSVYGPPARQVIGRIRRWPVLDYLAGELRWGAEHGSEAYAVLNACRALVYLTDDQIVSKIAGGETALSRGTGPAAVIRRALDQQCGGQPEQPPGSDALEFVLAAAEILDAAVAAMPPAEPD